MKTTIRFGALLVALAFTIGACGGSDMDSTSSGDGASDPAAITVVGKDNIFEPEAVEVPEGEEVTIEFKNEGEVTHTFTVPGLDVDTGNIAPGDSTTVTLTADSDTEFVCTIHVDSDDMAGELTVE